MARHAIPSSYYRQGVNGTPHYEQLDSSGLQGYTLPVLCSKLQPKDHMETLESEGF